jgi:hypothetical protein
VGAQSARIASLGPAGDGVSHDDGIDITRHEEIAWRGGRATPTSRLVAEEVAVALSYNGSTVSIDEHDSTRWKHALAAQHSSRVGEFTAAGGDISGAIGCAGAVE